MLRLQASLSRPLPSQPSTWSTAAHADIALKLGSTEPVSRLFAYPNNCNVICLRNWTLEQTVEHYLTQSVQRDGYNDVRRFWSKPITINSMPKSRVCPGATKTPGSAA